VDYSYLCESGLQLSLYEWITAISVRVDYSYEVQRTVKITQNVVPITATTIYVYRQQSRTICCQ